MNKDLHLKATEVSTSDTCHLQEDVCNEEFTLKRNPLKLLAEKEKLEPPVYLGLELLLGYYAVLRDISAVYGHGGEAGHQEPLYKWHLIAPDYMEFKVMLLPEGHDHALHDPSPDTGGMVKIGCYKHGGTSFNNQRNSSLLYVTPNKVI